MVAGSAFATTRGVWRTGLMAFAALKLVAFWLWAIIINLLMVPGFYDIALRDFGLSLGAIALAKLSRDFAR